ncbi:hypothetical protein ACFV8T_42420, partial [Streptomyces sp. NPDC059832]
MTITTQTPHRDPRTFVAPEVWEREVALLVRDLPYDKVMAVRFGERALGCSGLLVSDEGLFLCWSVGVSAD